MNLHRSGKFGCGDCIEVFSNKIDPILKRIHGDNRYLGTSILKQTNASTHAKTSIISQKQEEGSETKKLQEELKQAIKEERYEDAAKIRDEINKNKNESKTSNARQNKFENRRRISIR